MSESRTLTEAWREHGEALLGLGAKRWEVISDAVSAVAPSYGLVYGRAAELKRLLPERRQSQDDGAGLLRGRHGQRAQWRSAESGSGRDG